MLSVEKVNPPLETAYDIIIVAGQSNTCFGHDYDSLTQIPAEIWELGRYKQDMQIIQATPALYHHSRNPLKSGFGYDFARYYAEKKTSDRKVLVIACGESGSSFIKNKWNKGDKLYDDLIYRTNFILKSYPGSKVIAVLWQQGESDVENHDYQKNLDEMILNMRQDILSSGFTEDKFGNLTEIPFFLGGMVPFWTNRQADRINQQNIISNTEKRIANCYYVDPSGIHKPDDKIDMIHYSHENQVELAKRYWERFWKYCESKR